MDDSVITLSAHDQPQNVAALIEACGGASAVARRFNCPPSRISEMKRSGSIKVAYWAQFIALAAELKIPGVNNDTLAAMHTAASSEAAQ